VGGVHFYSTSTSSPVTNDATVINVFILYFPFGWAAELIDLQGSLLCGNLKDEEKIYMSIPDVFEQFYPLGWLIILLQTIYGLKQAAKTFFIEVNKSLTHMDYEQIRT
jgi:hypothetical protein